MFKNLIYNTQPQLVDAMTGVGGAMCDCESDRCEARDELSMENGNLRARSEETGKYLESVSNELLCFQT